MARLKPLSPDITPELKDHFNFFLGILHFERCSLLTSRLTPVFLSDLNHVF
jgi:hypothetical protein